MAFWNVKYLFYSYIYFKRFVYLLFWSVSLLSPSHLNWLKKIAFTKSAYSSEFHIKILKQNIQKQL